MARFLKSIVPWSFRYRRLVPAHHRNLIKLHRLPKPNWFVGAAEQASVPRDPALVREIESAKQRLRDYRAGQAPAPAPALVDQVADRREAVAKS